MKNKYFAFLMLLTFTSAFGDGNFTSFKSLSKTTNLTSGQLTSCQINFSRPEENICIDSKDGQQYPLFAQLSCNVNPDAKNVPAWMKKYCNGQLHSYEPGTSDFVEIQVFDDHSPRRMFTKHVHIQMGMCTADFDGEDLSGLVGNIYSCNQTTGKYEVSK